MKAAVYNKYGQSSQLHLSEIEIPQIKDDEVLINVKSVSINKGDIYMLQGNPFLIRLMNGISKPKKQVLGMDISGIVESIGSSVTEFEIGDEVFGNTTASVLGGLAEYARIKSDTLIKKPNNISFEAASALPQAATTAYQAILKSGLKKGDDILIHGASGGVGLYAVQIAKAFGANVTGVCSRRSVEIVKSNGADYTIDYNKEEVSDCSNKFDVILGINGYQSLNTYKTLLKDMGTYVMIGGSGKQLFEGMMLTPFYSSKKSKKMVGLGDSSVGKNDLEALVELVEKEKLIPYIDCVYPLEKVSEAFDYMINQHTKGKVVVKID